MSHAMPCHAMPSHPLPAQVGALLEEEQATARHVQFSSRRAAGEVLGAVEAAAAALGGSARRHGDKRCAGRAGLLRKSVDKAGPMRCLVGQPCMPAATRASLPVCPGTLAVLTWPARLPCGGPPLPRSTVLTLPVGGLGRSMRLQAHLFEVLPGVHVCQLDKEAGGWALVCGDSCREQGKTAGRCPPADAWPAAQAAPPPSLLPAPARTAHSCARPTRRLLPRLHAHLRPAGLAARPAGAAEAGGGRAGSAARRQCPLRQRTHWHAACPRILVALVCSCAHPPCLARPPCLAPPAGRHDEGRPGVPHRNPRRPAAGCAWGPRRAALPRMHLPCQPCPALLPLACALRASPPTAADLPACLALPALHCPPAPPAPLQTQAQV